MRRQVAISVCREKAGADESLRVAKEWIKEKNGTLAFPILNSPEFVRRAPVLLFIFKSTQICARLGGLTGAPPGPRAYDSGFRITIFDNGRAAIMRSSG